MRSARVRYARRGPPLRTAEGMTSRHDILPECGMTDFRDAGRFFQSNVAQATAAMRGAKWRICRLHNILPKCSAKYFTIGWCVTL